MGLWQQVTVVAKQRLMDNTASWLRTRVVWKHMTWEDGSEGIGALFQCRQQCLPWLADKRILVTIKRTLLSFYTADYFTADLLNIDNAIYSTNACDFNVLDGFFTWPSAESIFDGYNWGVVEDLIPTPALSQAIIDAWHKKAFCSGWWPTNRGATGLCFVRDLSGNRCVEVRPSLVLVYRGALPINQALHESRIIKSYQIHDFPEARGFLPDDEYIAIRLLLRHLRMFIWDYAVNADLPF